MTALINTLCLALCLSALAMTRSEAKYEHVAAFYEAPVKVADNNVVTRYASSDAPYITQMPREAQSAFMKLAKHMRIK